MIQNTTIAMIITIETDRPMISLFLYLFSSLVPSSWMKVLFLVSLATVGRRVTVLVRLVSGSLSSSTVAVGIGIIRVGDDGVDITVGDGGPDDGVDVAVDDDGLGDGVGSRTSILSTTGNSIKQQ